MPGSNSRSFEIWLGPNSEPEFIPYAGFPVGQYFDREALDEVLAKYP